MFEVEARSTSAHHTSAAPSGRHAGEDCTPELAHSNTAQLQRLQLGKVVNAGGLFKRSG
jgi:hypothetical protein